MSETDPIVLTETGGIATLTLSRPEIHNAFDDKLIARLTECLDSVAARRDLRALVLRGAGKSFSAGADLNWMKRVAFYGESENRRDAEALARMLNRLDTMPCFTVACVQGAAMGGGLGLAACCDMVIADAETMFALSEVKLGLIPATIAPYVIRALGPRQSRRFFQTGEKFNGRQALELGLVHELSHSPDDMDAKLTTVLEVVRANGPHAMRAAKLLVADFAGRPVTRDLMNDSAARIATIRSGEEAREGLQSFFEKRKPAWIT